MNLRILVSGFTAGALAVPLFHQVLLLLFKLAGLSKWPVYDFTPTKPLGVPMVISLAFWGGVWGVLLALLLTRFHGTSYWIVAVAVGALAPSLVAWLVVMPLKGLGFFGGGSLPLMAGSLLVNGAWAAGTALLLKLFMR